jgi:ABC-2 type transport system permease protein
MSSAFTGNAITTGYERFYGVLKRFGASSLSRGGLLTSKAIATVVLVLVQAMVLAAIGVAIGWRPHLGSVPSALAVTLLATTAYTGFALAFASLLRSETTTALATLLYTVLLIGGGVMFPTAQLHNVQYLVPITAHAEALRITLTAGDSVPAWAWNSLALWAVIAVLTAARTFRWD